MDAKDAFCVLQQTPEAAQAVVAIIERFQAVDLRGTWSGYAALEALKIAVAAALSGVELGE